MTLFPYQRLAYLYDMIKNESLPQQDLARHFNVSTRTIRTDVMALNDILAQYGASIKYQKNTGYQLIILEPNDYKRIPIEEKQLKSLPRNNRERVLELLIYFLTHPKAIKLDDIAENWFISRSTIQNDLIEVKETLEKYNLYLDKKPHYGMKLVGDEPSLRACLTDILWKFYIAEDQRSIARLKKTILNDIDLHYLEKILQNQFDRFELKISADKQIYLRYSCAISIARITMGQELATYQIDLLDQNILGAAAEIAKNFSYFLGEPLSKAELNYLAIQMAYCSRSDELLVLEEIKKSAHDLIEHILFYINEHYNYDIRDDEMLKKDLFIHVSSMLSRVKYQIHSVNPLLDQIKQFYPFTYDITLSALNNTEFKLTEDEISYLAVHIGVALERNYNTDYGRRPLILLVSELGNSTIKMIESKIKRDFPQVKISQIISYREYEQLTSVSEDFVVTTVRLTEKDKPIVKIAPFPTTYQWEQLARLAMIDRSMPYILEHFFDERLFMVIDKPISQQKLFKLACNKLESEGYVDANFYPSLIEREAIVSTLLGENIAIPHSVVLLAKKTKVFTILAPQGILWGKDDSEVANVIFLLAISKDEYEDAMSIYNLFVNFVKEKATKRLLNSQTFGDFQAIAKDCLGRVN